MTGGSLAIRGGLKAARNGAIMCAIFLAVIEGVGIGFQRMMAEQTRLDVSFTVLTLLRMPRCMPTLIVSRFPLRRRQTRGK